MEHVVYFKRTYIKIFCSVNYPVGSKSGLGRGVLSLISTCAWKRENVSTYVKLVNLFCGTISYVTTCTNDFTFLQCMVMIS